MLDAAAHVTEHGAEQLLRQQRALSRVLEAIATETALRPLLTVIVETACDLLDADDGAIGLFDPDRKVIRSEAVCRMPPNELGSERQAGQGLTGMVLKSRRPVIFERYGDIPGAVFPELFENSVIGVPIETHQGLIGVFGLGASPTRRRFDDADAVTLQMFAQHAALAIETMQRFDQVRRHGEQFALLTRVAGIISSSLDVDEVLRHAAQALHQLLGYPNVAIPLVSTDNPRVMKLSACAGPGYDQLAGGEISLPLSRGITGRAARTRQIQLVPDVDLDPDYHAFPGVTHIRCELAVPIVLLEEVLGVIVVSSHALLGEEDAACVQIVASHLAVAVNNARLYRSTERLTRLAERHRLRMDLHDSVAQLLASLNLLAQMLPEQMRADPIAAEHRAERLGQIARQALAEIRALVSEFRPLEAEIADAASSYSEVLERDGLPEALRLLVGHLMRDEVTVTLKLDERLNVDAETSVALFRIAQEALANAFKHAQASTIDLSVIYNGDRIIVEVTDDGVGLRARNGSDHGGMGLANMNGRVQALCGMLTIDNRRSGGTRVRAVVPTCPATGDRP